MNSENMSENPKKSCRIRKSICSALNKTKETYFECDFDIVEKLASTNAEDTELNVFKNGNIKIRLFDIIISAIAIGVIMTISKLFKK